MDLIYVNADKEDIGIFLSYTLDLAFGSDENDFELKMSTANHVCDEGYYIYIEDTEYGGIIDKIKVDTANDELTYSGRTWHGILGTKILCPDSGDDYLIVSGEANEVMGELLERMELTDLFAASSDNSGFTISKYQMNRYVDGYTGFVKMLASVGAKLKIKWEDGYATVYAEKIVDYSESDEFDSSQLDFEVEKNYHPTNHLICLGSGELAERTVIDLYADEDGNISYTQTQFGMDEVADVYDYSDVESDEELESGGIERLEEAWSDDTLNLSLDSDEQYDVGDIVGARENITGIFISKSLKKKIVKIENGQVTVSYEIGE